MVYLRCNVTLLITSLFALPVGVAPRVYCTYFEDKLLKNDLSYTVKQFSIVDRVPDFGPRKS